MTRTTLTGLLFAMLVVPAFADVMPISLTTSGYFSNAVGSCISPNQQTWYFDASCPTPKATVTFAGVTDPPITGTTDPTDGNNDFTFGTLTLSNGIKFPIPTNISTSADLDVTLAFTTPAGESLTVQDDLVFTATSGIFNGALGVQLVLTPGTPSKTFAVGNESYTVAFDSTQGSVAQLKGLGGIFLDITGTITSQGPINVVNTPIPEPGSVILLVTFLGVLAIFPLRPKLAA